MKKHYKKKKILKQKKLDRKVKLKIYHLVVIYFFIQNEPKRTGPKRTTAHLRTGPKRTTAHLRTGPQRTGYIKITGEEPVPNDTNATQKHQKRTTPTRAKCNKNVI